MPPHALTKKRQDRSRTGRFARRNSRLREDGESGWLPRLHHSDVAAVDSPQDLQFVLARQVANSCSLIWRSIITSGNSRATRAVMTCQAYSTWLFIKLTKPSLYHPTSSLTRSHPTSSFTRNNMCNVKVDLRKQWFGGVPGSEDHGVEEQVTQRVQSTYIAEVSILGIVILIWESIPHNST